MKVIGRLACGACQSVKIFLGVDERGDRVTVPGVLRDVIEREPNGLYLLACGHRAAGLPVSNNEFITLESGERLYGDGLENLEVQ